VAMSVAKALDALDGVPSAVANRTPALD